VTAAQLALLVVVVVAVVLYSIVVLTLVVVGRREAARAVAGFIPDCVVLFRRLVGDPRVPRRHKFLIGSLVPYLLLPFDLVPDFIPVAGQLDDAVLVAVVLRRVVRDAGPRLVEEHWPGPAASLSLMLSVCRR
jgi:uncharacterized membrane protein YkvA (DUF1232 family)